MTTTQNIIDEAHDQYTKDIEKASKELYPILVQILSEHSNKGTLEPDRAKMIALENTIRAALKKSGYSEATDNYLKAFEKIEKGNAERYGRDGLRVQPLLNEDILKFIKDKIIYDLKGQGASVNIVKPLEDAIRENVYLRRTFKEATEILKVKVVEKPYLTQYVSTIAFESLAQYNGAINDLVRTKYDLKYFYYVGSIIEDSRPVCDHLRDLGNRAISTDELKKVLDEYCPNGHPSQVEITYETVNGKKLTRKKGSGMFEGTNIENFAQMRGGWNCRHDVYWTRFPKK